MGVLEVVSLLDILIYVGVAVVSFMVVGLLCRSRSAAKQEGRFPPDDVFDHFPFVTTCFFLHEVLETVVSGDSIRSSLSGFRDRAARLRKRAHVLQIGRQVWRRMVRPSDCIDFHDVTVFPGLVESIDHTIQILQVSDIRGP